VQSVTTVAPLSISVSLHPHGPLTFFDTSNGPGWLVVVHNSWGIHGALVDTGICALDGPGVLFPALGHVTAQWKGQGQVWRLVTL
jgi:hypothetical protein